jgi:hypothetical protein
VTFVIYEWEAWSQFKIARAVPEATRLTACPEEHAHEVLARCPPKTVAFVFHLNATFSSRFPLERSDLVAGLEARGVAALNATVVDISKRHVQAQCTALGLPVAGATAEGDPNERVIIKTNHNFGGRAERLLTTQQLDALGIPRPSAIVSTAFAYQVMRRGDVPSAWWSDPALAIERYIENRWNRIYRAGFAGRRFEVLRMINPNALKKVNDPERTEKVAVLCDRDQLQSGSARGIEPAVGEAIVRFVDGAGMDFGAIDVMTNDAGQPFVLDVNATPYGDTVSLRRLMTFRRGLFELVADHASKRSRPLPFPSRGAFPTVGMLVKEVARLRGEMRSRSAAKPT